MTPRPMASRVMWATVLSAAAGGLLAATIAIFVVDRQLQVHGDKRLRGAAEVLAGELDELRSEQDESLDAVLDDENAEIITSGIRLAIYDRGEVVAGDARMPAPAPDQCATFGPVGGRIRACALPYDRWVLVAGQRSDALSLRWQFALAGLIALLAGTAVAAFLGARLTRWAVAPLERLSRSLEHSDPQDLVARSAQPADCAEVRQIEEALDALLRQFKALLDRHERFAADAAHELQTPLAALCLQLELMRDNATGDTRDDAAGALRRARGLALLVERLLMLASPAGDLRRGFEPVALDDIVRDALDALDDRARSRVELDSGGEGLVAGDPVLLRSMVSNAVDNALKFSAPHPVRVALTEGAERVRLEIRDRGPGLPPDVQRRVFDPFYRERADATPGHGLGLALVAHIAEVHGADARFDDVDEGARLIVSLPRL